MENKIKVIVWHQEDAGHVYQLNAPGEGERFFRDLLNNAEIGGDEMFHLEAMTQEEFDECVKNGEEAS